MSARFYTLRWTRQMLPAFIFILCFAPVGAQGISDLFLPLPVESATLTPRQAQLLEVIEQRPGAEDVELRQAHNPRALAALSAVALRVGEERIEVARERVAEAHGERFLWTGPFGEGGEMQLVVDGDEITGTVQKPSGELFKIEPLGGGLHTVSRLDQSAVGECATEDGTEQDSGESDASAAPSESLSGGPLYSSRGSTPTIDVLVVYTPAAENASANIGNEIALAAADMNGGFGNSDVPATVSVVHTAQIAYSETGNFATDVDRLQGTSDGYMDSVHSLRTQHAADVVILFVNANTSVYGRVYRIGQGAAEAFAVVEWDYATGNHTFAHEVGHLAGARHDNDPNTTPYPYGHGYRPSGQSWRTIMATGNPGSSPFRINYWSNPDKVFGGTAMGTTSINDNVRAWENSASTMAGFYSPPPPPDPLTASISGPTVLGFKQNGTWTANYAGGSGAVSYQWHYRPASSSTWYNGGTASTYSRQMVDFDFELRLRVTRGAETAEDLHYVTYFPGGAARAGEALPAAFALHGAAPNPLRGEAEIRYDLPEASPVSLVVYDVLGRAVARLVDEAQEAGYQRARFDGSGLPSGVYVVRLVAGSFVATERVTVVR
jgi:hypothetical protein